MGWRIGAVIVGIVILVYGYWELATYTTDQTQNWYTLHTIWSLIIIGTGVGVIAGPYLRRR